MSRAARPLSRALVLASPLLLLAGCMARSRPAGPPHHLHRTESAAGGGYRYDGSAARRRPPRRSVRRPVIVTRKLIRNPIPSLERQQVADAKALARLASGGPAGAPPPAPPKPSVAPSRDPSSGRPGTAAPTSPRPRTHVSPKPLRCRRICRHVKAICYATRRICHIAGRLGDRFSVDACRRGRLRCGQARKIAQRTCGGCGSAQRAPSRLRRYVCSRQR